MTRLFFSLFLSATGLLLNAKVYVAEVFTSNMVIQQQKNIIVWGKADAGEKVNVRLGSQNQTVTADAQGKWSVALKPMNASMKPLVMTIKSKQNKILLKNLLIGEVWLASGQSNMEYSMHEHLKYKKPKKGDPDRLLHEWEQARNENIRVLYVRKDLNGELLPTEGWQRVDTTSLKPFSAPAWFFAKMLQDSLRVPVGIITSAWGGTKIEVWTPDKGDRYNHMIRPMVPMALRGFLWYQGETNLINGDIEAYAPKFEHLVDSWRKAWGDDTLPFYYVQISPYTYSQRKDYIVPHTWQDLPRFWQVQARGMEIPHTGMVVTTDLPEDLNDIHPPYKWIVGERLCRWALRHTYGYDHIECQGPVLHKATIQGDKAIMEFDHADDGLMTADGKEPDWFYTNSRGGRFYKTKAVISGNSVIVDINPKERHPVVRFGFDEVAQPNLRNHAGLPAQPFEYKF